MASPSRSLLLIGFLFMVMFVLFQDVSARELAETSTQTDSVNKDGYGGRHKCKYGKCCKGPHCHGAAEETQATDTTTIAHTEVNAQEENTDAVHEDGYGGGHKCKHGKCCKGPHCHGAADQEVNTNTVHEDGYGHGRKCKYGKCCKGPHCHQESEEDNHN